MSELFKDKINSKTIHDFAACVKSVYAPFPIDEFVNAVMDETWDKLELKARGRQICINMRKFLPEGYGTALSILDEVIKINNDGFFCLIFPDFVEVYGQDEENWDLSINALENYTKYGSSEFAVRPFIINHEERMMAQMFEWSKNENEDVRRLSSEGCRPVLPWGQALPSLKADPAPILPILTQLKTDSSPYVRKSVANNLNDISKTNPDFVVKLAKQWYGESDLTNWIIKHGCRTLLKKGNRDILALFGYDDVTSVEVSDFAVATPKVIVGDDLTFTFTVRVKKAMKVRLEFGIDYMKARGKRSRKIFQISESAFKENSQKAYTRKHSFADVSVRKHYPGIHSVTLIVNGMERGTLDFEVEAGV
ncbi:MAG: DNA alkylation repair protein [Lachnospiraceae bacterium]|nr:DNA alkylation repair protein [Lachnospiraceae bacterium]